jgi:hypothetical protein
MSGESEGIWKEVAVVYFKEVSLQFSGGTEYNHEKYQDKICSH